jgi:hypothetical protein
MWKALTKTFYAESFRDGVAFAHTYDATDEETAESIARKYGWTFLGELDDEEEELLAAEMERAMFDPIIH